jgi:hypothetical protein
MNLNEQYIARKKDIDAYYAILEFIDNIETYKHSKIECLNTTLSLDVSTNMQQCMRASCIILLYNIIESTIMHCLQSLYDAVQDDSLKYKDLTDHIKHMWIKSQYSYNIQLKKMRDKTKEIMDGIEINLIEFDTNTYNDISGNLDMRKINELTKSLGIDIELHKMQDKDRIANDFLSIKNKRNKLAHGEDSFSTIGSLLTFSDLRRYKDNVYVFLGTVINKFDDFIENKKYYKCVD